MNRPEPPKTHDPYKRESYEEYNRYFNEAEKYIDFKEEKLEACAEKNWEKREKLEAVKKLRDELQEYKGFMDRASHTHAIANPERHKERVDFLEKLNEILNLKTEESKDE